MNELEISDQELSSLADEAIGLAKDYWASLKNRPSYPVTSGEETAELFLRPWEEEGRGREILQEFKLIAEHARPSGGRFFGYVFGSAEPVGALGDLLASVLNQNVTAWRSAPAAVTIEQAVVGWLADAVGCAGFKGSLCGGGSAANLMALAMAREAKLPANETGARRGIVYASEQAHMSIPKAIALLGIGRQNLRLVPVDEALRMRVDALQAAITEDREAGYTPIAIVATAGTVATGSIDPLAELADLARRERLWLHVDGAYGGLAALAVPEKFEGLSLVDSLSLDAHKWLYQPLECGCLLFRDPAIARQTFAHSGDYVRVLNRDPIEAFVFFEETIELSRRFRALKLWMSLQYHGRRTFATPSPAIFTTPACWLSKSHRSRSWRSSRPLRSASSVSAIVRRTMKQSFGAYSREVASICRMRRLTASSHSAHASSTTGLKRRTCRRSCQRSWRPLRNLIAENWQHDATRSQTHKYGLKADGLTPFRPYEFTL